jgi:DHA1 family inner membrane transport protein
VCRWARSSLAGPGAGLAQSLPASAVNAGIALGSFAGGVAIGAFSISAAVLTGVVIAVIAVAGACATSFLQPPAVEATVAPEPRTTPR